MCIRLRVLHEEQREYEFDSELLTMLSKDQLGELYSPVKTYFRSAYRAKISMSVLDGPNQVRQIDFCCESNMPKDFDLRSLFRVFWVFAKAYVVSGATDIKAYKNEMAKFIPLIDKHPEMMRMFLAIMDEHAELSLRLKSAERSE